jgi:hypothetical protein
MSTLPLSSTPYTLIQMLLYAIHASILRPYRFLALCWSVWSSPSVKAAIRVKMFRSGVEFVLSTSE